MTRYLPSRRYFWAGLATWVLAALSGWVAMDWAPAAAAFVFFLLSSAVLVLLALRPPIEIHDTHLLVGSRAIPWSDIRRVDRTGWLSPLIVHLTLFDDSRVTLVYPGDLDSAHSLLRQLRRHAREALIDGVPHRQFWGEALSAPADRRRLPSPRYRLLRPEDEEEVERLYQRLRAVRRLDADELDDEK
ncbi:MAG TPA: hypothetical protein VNJ11_15890 [Bryobacteraceae bacterium]|nr:hypothetical protein [Bryobacteraceae bacterium]